MVQAKSTATAKLKAAVIGGGILIAVLLIAVSAVFANAYGARRAGDNAASLHKAETLLSASAILRSQVGQAALISTYVAAQPTADPAAVGIAREEAAAALTQFLEAADRYGESYPIAGTDAAADDRPGQQS